MNMITLTPRDFTGSSISAFPEHVSNGHWMIHKSQVANRTAFASVETCKVFAPKLDSAPRVSEHADQADRILREIPDTDPIVWTVQPWIYVSGTTIGRGRTARRIESDHVVLTSGEHTCYVNREYLSRFGIDAGMVLHSKTTDGTGVLATPDRLFVVMPMRIGNPIADLAGVATAAARKLETADRKGNKAA